MKILALSFVTMFLVALSQIGPAFSYPQEVCEKKASVLFMGGMRPAQAQKKDQFMRKCMAKKLPKG